MAHRVMDPRQQGARISWGSTLFQQVERVQLPTPPQPPALELPDVSYSTLAEWHAALASQTAQSGESEAC